MRSSHMLNMHRVLLRSQWRSTSSKQGVDPRARLLTWNRIVLSTQSVTLIRENIGFSDLLARWQRRDKEAVRLIPAPTDASDSTTGHNYTQQPLVSALHQALISPTAATAS